MKRILSVDDDPAILASLKKCLETAGYEVTCAASVPEALAMAHSDHFDLATVDLRLADSDGLDLTRTLRERFGMGIIIVSGLDDPTDKVIGLEIGADDYLPKPFHPRELVARVRSVLRRIEDSKGPAGAETHDGYSFDGWRLDIAARELRDPDGKLVPLTSGEYKLLQAFVTRPNRVLSRDELLDMVCTNDTPAFDRSIDVRIGRLRKKLNGDIVQSGLIKTVRNGGYIFSTKVIAVSV
jgi:two-component system OmpR family response regulator